VDAGAGSECCRRRLAAGRAHGWFGGLGQGGSVEQNDKTLTMSQPARRERRKTVYNLDGSESKNPLTFNGNTIDRVSKAKWDGTKLVITTTTNFNGNPDRIHAELVVGRQRQPDRGEHVQHERDSDDDEDDLQERLGKGQRSKLPLTFDLVPLTCLR
jgi:hypothetical protein